MFYVTGLPRTGTTWFSNLLTARKSFCFHEPLVNYSSKDFEQYLWMKTKDYNHVGISDSSLCTYYKKYVKPDEPMLILKRDPNEVIKSLNRQFGFDTSLMMDKMIEMLDGIEHNNVMYFNHEDLNDSEKIWKACDFLLEGSWMDKTRIKFLIETNVQRNEDYIETLRHMRK